MKAVLDAESLAFATQNLLTQRRELRALSCGTVAGLCHANIADGP
jgi:hypothetical protein